jgi:hypothetical protein
MIKRLKEFWEHLGRDRGRLKATVRVDFYPHKAARAAVEWRDAAPADRDLVPLAIFFYARILYELAELNETRVANELITFLSQVVDLVLAGEDAPHRPRLPLGELQLQTEETPEPPSRSYRADLFSCRTASAGWIFPAAWGRKGCIYRPPTWFSCRTASTAWKTKPWRAWPAVSSGCMSITKSKTTSGMGRPSPADRSSR